jgi:hypothetical protein
VSTSHRFLIGLAALLAAGDAFAAQGGNGKSLAADKKQIVKFDGDTIDGDLLRPDGDLMAVRPEMAMPNLVVPPSSFQRASQRTLLNAAGALGDHRAQTKHAAR